MLTEVQIKNIHNLDGETCLQIIHECVERLGLMSVEEYYDLTKVNKRTIYLRIKDKRIKTDKLLGRIAIIFNDNI